MKTRQRLLLLFFVFTLPACLFAQSWQMKQAPLMTSFSSDVNPGNVLPEYPRPQLVRKQWMNLNGIWQYQPGINQNDAFPAGTLSGTILVPFSVESAISGVMEHHARLWYRRLFTVPEDWSGQRIILHFGAVDYEAQIYLNGTSIGTHRGGYDPFSLDITDYLSSAQDQELTVRVFDPTDAGGFPRGKQTLYPQGIMYTSTTGIWQSVWLEPVPETHIDNIKMVPDIDQSVLKLTANVSGSAGSVSVTARVTDNGKLIQTLTGYANQEISVPIPNEKLWSPDSPFLYDLKVTLSRNGDLLDSVGSYFGMRKISVKDENGIKKLYLNNAFLFQMGPLDQGFWPDGIYTAPTDEALRYDIEKMKEFGFNMVRKHIKVEPYRWYYWADKLGLMVWQDMPSVNSYTQNPQPIDKVAFEKELTSLVEKHWNSPSIVMWVVFNEGQGQHDTPELVSKVKLLDPSRLVNQASGGEWFNAGDILDLHSYPAPGCPTSTSQAMVCGEYGGVGYKIPGHLWNDGFGYVMANNESEYLKYYDDFTDQLTMFKTNQGLSAAIYTEITDVEIELNGLMTYDRQVKADIERIRQANQKVITKNIYVTEVVPTSEKQAQVWKYITSTPAQEWYLTDFDDSSWKSGQGGFGTDGTPGAVVRTIWNTSDIWIRRDFDPGDLSKMNVNDLVLKLHHDEDCEVYINGVPAATVPGYTTSYTIVPISSSAQKALKSNSRNVIAIHCKQTSGGQYIDAGVSLLTDDKATAIVPILQDGNGKENRNYLYPNPAGDKIYLSTPLKNFVKAVIINADGKEVAILTGRTDWIDVSNLKSGIYLLKVNDGNSSEVYKFIKTAHS